MDALVVSQVFTFLLERRAPGKVSLEPVEFGVSIKPQLPMIAVLCRQDRLYRYVICEEGAG